MLELIEAVLNLYDGMTAERIYSGRAMDLRDIPEDYLGRHLDRIMKDPRAARASFDALSPVPNMLGLYRDGQWDFLRLAQALSEAFFAALSAQEVRQDTSLIVVRFTDENAGQYLALLVLDGRQGFLNHVDADETGTVACSIELVQTLLPQPTQQLRGYCMIDLEKEEVRLRDVRIKTDDEPVALFEDQAFLLMTEPSSRDAFADLHTAAMRVADTYAMDPVEASVRTHAAIKDNAEESEALDTKEVAKRVFPQSPQLQRSFVAGDEEQGALPLPETLHILRDYARKKTKTERLICDNGIELKIPSELMTDPQTVEILLEPDGTQTIHLRGIAVITPK
jgi:hypothetical protein